MNKPEWKIRRRLIYGILMFCASTVVWVLLSNDIRTVAEMIVMSSYALGGTTISSYIFGAVWDDNNYMNNIKGKE
jgi:hypothetical protein